LARRVEIQSKLDVTKLVVNARRAIRCTQAGTDNSMSASTQVRDKDARTAARASIYLAASMYREGSSFPVKIRNISSSGALLESATAFAPGDHVELVRGALTVQGVVAWSDLGRCGITFRGCIDLLRWSATKTNKEQKRVDEIVTLIKGRAGPPSAPIHCSNPEPAPGAGPVQALTADLARASELLRILEEELAKDTIVMALYPTALQNLDLAMQMIAAVGTSLTDQSDPGASDPKRIGLRRIADQALQQGC
jgi:hypothetical protein